MGSWRTWGLRVGAVLVVGALGAGWWAASAMVASPAQRAADAAPPSPSAVTASVELRVLSDVVVTRGDVVPGSSVKLGADLSGIVTRVLHRRGDTVDAGGALVEVAGRPLMLMQGSVPVFRDLRPGESGVDVRQLQEDLLALGFDPKETDGTFGPGTKAAVVAWYRSLGYEPAETSTDASTNLEAAEQRVRAASQAVDNAKAALKRAGKPVPPSTALSLDARVLDAQVALDSVTSAGTASVAHAAADRKAAAERLAALQQQVPSDPAAISRAASDLSAADSALSGAQTDAANKISSAKRGLEIAVAARTEGLSPPDLSDQELAVSSAEETLASEQASFDRLNRTTGPMVPSAEIVFVPTTPVVVDSLVATVGEKGTGDWIRLATSSLVVSTTLTRANRTLLPIGSKVVVDDEASATSFSGVLTAIADDASTSSTGETGYVATIAPDTPIAPSLSGQNFRVTITARQTNTKVLVVPLSAVFSRADGSEVVSKVVGTKQVDVRVVPGLSAGGYVAINPVQPQELTAGDQVVVAERAA